MTNALGDYDFFEITPAANHPVEFHAVEIGFVTAEGDTLEDYVDWGVVRGHTTSGNGAATTPRCLSDSALTANFTAERVASTPASVGTTHELAGAPFNIRSGLDKIWTPETRPRADAGDTTIVVRMFSTLDADDIASGTLYVEEH